MVEVGDHDCVAVAKDLAERGCQRRRVGSRRRPNVDFVLTDVEPACQTGPGTRHGISSGHGCREVVAALEFGGRVERRQQVDHLATGVGPPSILGMDPALQAGLLERWKLATHEVDVQPGGSGWRTHRAN